VQLAVLLLIKNSRVVTVAHLSKQSESRLTEYYHIENFMESTQSIYVVEPVCGRPVCVSYKHVVNCG